MAPGYETYDKSEVPFVMKLKKSLYDLRQSPKNWFGTMDDHLSNIGFRSLKSDPCVYVSEDKSGTAILTFYADDILLLGNNKQLLGKLKKQLMDRFEMTDLGDVSKVLGMNVTQNRENGTITIHQKEYTEDILERYGMANCNVAFMPGVGPEISLDQPADRLLNEQGKQRYQSIAGALMYLAQVSRFDILNAVNQLARSMSKPSKAYMGVAKHVLRYLAGSVIFPIPYKRGPLRFISIPTASTLRLLPTWKSPTFSLEVPPLFIESSLSSSLVPLGLAALALSFGDSGAPITYFNPLSSCFFVAPRAYVYPPRYHVLSAYYAR